jgi:hypothetical protein
MSDDDGTITFLDLELDEEIAYAILTGVGYAYISGYFDDDDDEDEDWVDDEDDW